MLTLSRARNRPASMPVIVGVAATVFAVIAAVGIVSQRSSAPGHGPASDQGLLAYADAIFPAAQHAGKAIVAGIRPDINEFEAGRISVEVWNIDMLARQRELTEAKSAFDRASAPASVGDAPKFFDLAFDNYLEAVRLFLEAGTVEGTARTTLIARAASIGEAGDDAFDQGTARIQSARRAIGLGRDLRFSDKPAR